MTHETNEDLAPPCSIRFRDDARDGFIGSGDKSPGCPTCHSATEHWWSYCAMCGYHIASGALSSTNGNTP